VCLDRAKNSVRIEELRIANEDSEDSKNVMLFRMVEILFELFVGNSNGELRRTTTILSSPQNNRITTILTISEQQMDTQLLFYSENSSYSAIPGPSKHTLIVYCQWNPQPRFYRFE
jgi:hypothetical protein